MQRFFVTFFGGLLAIGCGVLLAYVFSQAYRYLMADAIVRSVLAPHSTGVADGQIQADGTSISGLTRTVRFTADEEENLLNAATMSLPKGKDSKITADAYLVKDLTNGGKVVMYNDDRLVPIASLSKLVTAIIARKLIPSTDRITITREIMSTYGNTAQFKVGETFTASDIMYPLLMVSSNDAAEALAMNYGRDKFIKAMNDFVQSIGAYRTSFADPSGLSPQNVSTADDLAIILEWIRNNDPGIIDITLLKNKVVRSHDWVNPTHFLNWSNYLGGKNGYLPEADRTGAALFKLNNDVYAVILLGSASRDEDMVKLLAKVK